jgi:heterodisulfide reductase subunit A
VAQVDEGKCVSCGACITVCSYGAIDFYESPRGRRARVNPVLCKGDGLCNAMCPTGAISLRHYTEDELLAQIDAIVPEQVSVEVD